MRKLILLILLSFFALSCTTNYYTVLLTEDTNFYKNYNDQAVVITIPKDTQVYLSSKANKKKL